MMNTLKTKADILSMDEKPIIEKVHIAPWKADIYIRVVSSEVMDSFQSATYGDSDIDKKSRMKNFRARLAAICICDENGLSLFTEKDASELGKKSTHAMNIIVKHCQRINGITAENKDELLKNSEKTQGEDSNSN
jgi:hypothetical protein